MTRPKAARLGRGLSALIGDGSYSPGAPDPSGDSHEAARTLPIDVIDPGPFQPRDGMNPEGLRELAESIRTHGILQPILVRPAPDAPHRFQIIGGERRWRAAQLVPLHEVPVVIRRLDDREAMAAALVENLQRQDLQALEEAEGYRRLQEEFGMTQDMLGQAVGKSRSHVANTLRLLALPGPVRDLLRDGSLTAGHARALLSSADPAGLARHVVQRGLNVRQTEALAAGKPRDQSSERSPARPDPDIRELERTLSASLGLAVSIRHDGQSGQVAIRFRDLDQLEGLLRLLLGGA